MGDDPRGLALAGQSVARLPRDVAEQDVDLEVLLERLAFEEGGFERVAQRADGIGEDVVEHGTRIYPSPSDAGTAGWCRWVGGGGGRLAAGG